MFRAIIKDRKNLDGPQIADIPVLGGTISEDKAQKATSSLFVSDFPDEAKLGDVVEVYDGTGKFYYWGVISSKGESVDDEYTKVRTRTIECEQFESLFGDEQLILPHTTTNQKKIFNGQTVSDTLFYYLSSREYGYMTMANTPNAYMSPNFTGFIDPDVKENFKGIRHEIIDDGLDRTGATKHMICPIEKEVVDLEDLLYGAFSKYRRIIRPYFNLPSLPDEYQPVLYIESDGTGQYVDTGFGPGETHNNILRIELDAQFNNVTSSGNKYLLSDAFWSSNSDARRQIFVGVNPSDTTFRMLNGSGQSNWVSVGTADTNRHLFVVDQIKRCYTLYNNVNFTQMTMANLANSFYLFAYRTATEQYAPITIYSSGKIYGLRIYSSGTLIVNMVPCYRKADGVVGFYDTVRNSFHTNSGTGSLIKSDKVYDKNINIAIFRPDGTVPYNYGQRTWDYNEKVLFDSMENIKNVNIVDEEVDTNTVMVYSDDGTSLRGAFTVLKDGTIQQMTTNTSVDDRYGTGKTDYVFDSTNEIKDIAQNSLPASQFDHKIEFTITFDGEHKFSDFNLGQIIKFYSKTRPGKVYDSCLSAWSYDIIQNSDVIHNAKFTLGNVRTTLTSKINLNSKKKKK